MRKSICLVLACMLSTALFVAGTETGVPIDKLGPPNPEKALVYFFLPGKTPVIPSISLFDGDAQLPNLLGAREYVRYEFDPGPHTFIVQPMVPGLPEYGQWVHGDLEKGGIYAALISGFMADLVIRPLTGRMDPKLLLSMKREHEHWPRIVELLQAKPPKPPGKERKHTGATAYIAGYEANNPTSAFSYLVRLNPEKAHPEKLAVDRLPEPVPGKSLVVFFVPEKKADISVTLFDGDQRLGPDLQGGAHYTYETTPGPADIWVSEVRAAYTKYRVVTGNLAPDRVYAFVVYHSLGNGGARLLGLTGNPDHRPSFIPEPELWSDIEGIWDSDGGALQRIAPVDAAQMKETAKKLKKKTKKRRSEFAPLR